MKQPKKTTRHQKELITKLSKKKLRAEDWSVISETAFELKIINKYSKEIKMLYKKK